MTEDIFIVLATDTVSEAEIEEQMEQFEKQRRETEGDEAYNDGFVGTYLFVPEFDKPR